MQILLTAYKFQGMTVNHRGLIKSSVGAEQIVDECDEMPGDRHRATRTRSKRQPANPVSYMRDPVGRCKSDSMTKETA